MDGSRKSGSRAVAVRIVAAVAVTIGAVAWISTMMRMNPGSQWFWDHESSRTLYTSLEILFTVGVAAVAAHAAALVLVLRLTSQRAGFWLGQAGLTGLSGMAGLALYASSGNPRLLFATPLLVPIAADALAVVLIGVAWRVMKPRPSDQDTSMWPESTGLEWLESATVIVPLGIGLALTGGWLNIVFDESMGPDDGSVALWALFVSVPAVVWAQILVAVSRRRSGGHHADDTVPENAHGAG